MLKLLTRLSKREWLMAAISVVLIAFQVSLELRLPEYMSEITILVQTPGSDMSAIWTAGVKMLSCALGSLCLAVIVGYFAARIAAGFASRLRLDIFRKVQCFSLGEINKFSTASLITRSTNDVTQVQMLIAMGLQIIIRAPIMAVWAITKIVGKGDAWTIATCVAILFIISVLAIAAITVMPRFKKIQALTDNLNGVTRENLTGLRVIRAYNAEAYQEGKFKETNENLTSSYLFTTRVMAIMMPCLTLVMNGLSLAVYWIGAHLINGAGMMDKMELFSNMVVFSQYAIQVVLSFVMMVFIFIMLPRVLVSAKRINEVLATNTSVQDGKGSLPEDGRIGEVEFKNVSFKYPEAEDYILRDINFTAKRGETVAFIGSTGSGKSTIINLIPRFYDVTEGQVLIDGIDVRDYNLKELRNRLGYIPQRQVMFAGTVASNLAFGDNGKPAPSTEQIARAASIAQASDFIEQMAEGLDAPISQGGTNISGGQKQRLSIARAVCRAPEIFIFDDSFSALDFKTDKALRNALNSELSDSTRLIVAQRIGTIRDADKIVVLERGKAVGVGTHQELLKTCEVYREIAMSQLSEEELNND